MLKILHCPKCKHNSRSRCFVSNISLEFICLNFFLFFIAKSCIKVNFLKFDKVGTEIGIFLQFYPNTE